MGDPKKAFLEITALAWSNPKAFSKAMKEMSREEFWEYERERVLCMEEMEIARKEKRLH